MWPVLELILICLFIYLVVSQIIWPALTGGQIFWLFRKDQKQVVKKEKELAALGTQEEIINLETNIREKREALNEKMVNRVARPSGGTPAEKAVQTTEASPEDKGSK